MSDRAKENEKIVWKLNRSVKSWLGSEGNFGDAILVDTKTGEQEEYSCDESTTTISIAEYYK